jgi:hypothetical protein
MDGFAEWDDGRRRAVVYLQSSMMEEKALRDAS